MKFTTSYDFITYGVKVQINDISIDLEVTTFDKLSYNNIFDALVKNIVYMVFEKDNILEMHVRDVSKERALHTNTINIYKVHLTNEQVNTLISKNITPSYFIAKKEMVEETLLTIM